NLAKMGSARLYYIGSCQGCHCINLYCLMGDATFPSALAPSVLVPNAITLRGLIY
ncbi:hypothetical protein K492DRAFT_171098, partial [Lichtheimia hyalospora FSU 10163]